MSIVFFMAIVMAFNLIHLFSIAKFLPVYEFIDVNVYKSVIFIYLDHTSDSEVHSI